jgi:hypothetical protein
MMTREQPPMDLEAPLMTLPNGDLWLYSTKHTRRDICGGGSEYKVYTAIPEIKKALAKLNGVEQASEYFLRKGKAYDFIVQAYAIKPVLDMLQSGELRQLPLVF